jgi:hypothetical protein
VVVVLCVGIGAMRRERKKGKESKKSEDGEAVSMEEGALIALPRARQQQHVASS